MRRTRIGRRRRAYGGSYSYGEPLTVNRNGNDKPDRAVTIPRVSETVHGSPFTVHRALPETTAAHRALDPPEPVEVICDGETPRAITWRGRQIAVTRALGPERLSGDWWDDGYRRDYWRCESQAGEMVVFLDRADDSWRLQNWGD